MKLTFKFFILAVFPCLEKVSIKYYFKTMRTLFNLLAATAALLLTTLLTACGGSTGFPPVITAVKPQSLSYGRTATIYLGGKDLRSSLVVESNGGCTNPSFGSSSSTDTLVLNCLVTVVGDLPLTIKSATGEVIYTTTLSVPKPQVSIITNKGSFTLELDLATAPITVKNFLAYVRGGYYSNTLFHRVIPGFVAQAGGYTTGLVRKPGQLDPIELESNKGLSNARATVAMARTNVFNSATSEFYVNLVDNTFLDYKNAANPGYAVFGTVVQGMDVVDAIAAVPTGVFNGSTDVPLTDITITMAIQSK
jgi:cyclophilin family peptidyl-prolyl cis-trans isomerase